MRDATFKDGTAEKLAKWTSTRVNSVIKETKKTAYYERPVLDVIVIQYPDPDHRYFHVGTQRP